MVKPVDTRAPVDKWGGRTTSSGVWVGPRRKAGTPNPGSAVQQVRQEYNDPDIPFYDAAKFVRDAPKVSALAQQQPPPAPSRTNVGAGSGGGRRGGGGGRAVPDVHAQAQMDYLSQLLSGKSYTAQPLTGLRTALQTQRDALGGLRTTVNNASAADQQAATGAYNNLDTYLGGHQINPYADVRLQQAQRAPDMNPYLASQGVQGTNYQASNPEDQGYGAFQNILSLLGANQLAGNQSQLNESQMGRTYVGQQIGAMDNAYLANIGQQDVTLAGKEGEIAAEEQKAQMALDAERRQAAMQLAQLIAQGAKAPDLAALGLA